MGRSVEISELMRTSGVKFGTSGARGLVLDMKDEVCYAYTKGFIQYLEGQNILPSNDSRIAVAGDLRKSTDRIMAAVAKAVKDCGYEPVNCGKIPSPAVALYGLQNKIPAVMVTGSHIPDDRNGIKYNKPDGEVLKDDEKGMMAQVVELPDIFDSEGMLKDAFAIGALDETAEKRYIDRYIKTFRSDFLKGKKIGLYQHSAVGRDILYEIYTRLGAEVIKFGSSEVFLPVDTEAIRPEDAELAKKYASEYSLDAVVSTDGDSDRPLVSDENGKWLRGDVAGIICGQYLNADAVVTPVSCNTAAEKCGSFATVYRTRIGSPYVVAQMRKAFEKGHKCVVGYEANGGFLIETQVAMEDAVLEALPTRDAVIIHLGVIGMAMRKGLKISDLLAELPQRYTASDRLKEFPSDQSKLRISELIDGGGAVIESTFTGMGSVSDTDTTDGLRITFENGEIVHLRPSGNAPELRCYTEADTEERSIELNKYCISIMNNWRI